MIISEVKLSSKQIDEAADNILRIRAKMKEASFMMVITGGELAYKRKDGFL